MTALTRSQRVFNSVFPPEESPFLSGYVHTEQLRPDQQRLWDVVTRILHPNFLQPLVERDDVTSAWRLKGGEEAWEGLGRSSRRALENWYLDTVRQELIALWTSPQCTVEQMRSGFTTFIATVSSINTSCLNTLHLISASDLTMSKYRHSFLGILTKHFPTTTIAPALKSYLMSSFTHNAILDTSSPPPFIDVLRVLQSIGLTSMMERELSFVVAQKVREFINIEARGDWGQRYNTILSDWVDNGLAELLRFILGRKEGESVGEDALKTIALRALTDLRINELFDIIKEFPESTPAIEDLKLCIETPHQRNQLVSVFRQACAKRLLHPGADTLLIITQYISTIKAFRILDPPGVLLDKVSRPIQKYLKERDNTVSCILSGLMGDESNEMWMELNSNTTESGWAVGEEEPGYFDDMNWEPTPIDAAPGLSAKVLVNVDYRKTTSGDIVSMLLNIYDTKEVFVKELQVILAERLLSSKDYDVEKETRNIEMIKARFGEANTQSCDVMLKDIIESKRVDRLIHNRTQNIIHPRILSRFFWPPLRDEKLIMPPELQEQFTEYANEYAKIKRGRKLSWMDHLGTVDVEIQLEDRQFLIEASPIQTAILYAFQDHEQLDADELCRLTGISAISVKRAILFWVLKGVLKEIAPDTFQVLEHAEEASPNQTITASAMVSAPSNVQSTAEQAESEMEIYWTFIVGMLTNLGVLPVERIQSMLTMFVPPPNPYNRSEEELRVFLADEVKKGRLEFVKGEGGGYKLVQS